MGTYIHIHALECAGVWCYKREDSQTVPMFLDNQEEGGKGVKITLRLYANQCGEYVQVCVLRQQVASLLKMVNSQDRGPQC